MAKTMKCTKVREIHEDEKDKAEFQTTLEPKLEDEEEGVFWIKIKTTSRILSKGDELALKDVSDLMEKAEGQSDLSGYE